MSSSLTALIPLKILASAKLQEVTHNIQHILSLIKSLSEKDALSEHSPDKMNNYIAKWGLRPR